MCPCCYQKIVLGRLASSRFQVVAFSGLPLSRFASCWAVQRCSSSKRCRLALAQPRWFATRCSAFCAALRTLMCSPSASRKSPCPFLAAPRWWRSTKSSESQSGGGPQKNARNSVSTRDSFMVRSASSKGGTLSMLSPRHRKHLIHGLCHHRPHLQLRLRHRTQLGLRSLRLSRCRTQVGLRSFGLRRACRLTSPR